MPLPPVPIRSLVAAAALSALAGCSGKNMYSQPEPRFAKAPPGAETLAVPPGQLPPPGECRLWFPGRPPGRQPRPRPCPDVEASAPAGAWILYRPSQDRSVVHVRYVDDRRAGVVVWIRIFDASSGAFVRDMQG
jgi:hypothetical protein